MIGHAEFLSCYLTCLYYLHFVSSVGILETPIPFSDINVFVVCYVRDECRCSIWCLSLFG